MKDASMSLGIYLEIKDAEICGGGWLNWMGGHDCGYILV